MAGQNILALVDALIQAEKTLGGAPDWQQVGNGDEERLVLPIFVDGVSSNASVEIKAYPNSAILRFRVMLLVGKCIWRIDHTEYEQHVNPIDTFSTVTPPSFTCPHFHSWADNRRYCTSANLPSKLKIARPLETHHRSFDAVFRWFCGEVNIAQPHASMVYLPARTRLM